MEDESQLAASLRELFQEQRRSGENYKRKWGKKVEPGIKASAKTPEQTELNVEEAELEILLTSGAISTISVSTDQNKLSAARLWNVSKQRPIRQTRKANHVNSSTCGIYRIKWKN